MNNLSLSIVTLIHYNIVVRDSLEYAIVKPTYSLDAYEKRKKALLIEIEEKTPLKQFIDNSKEQGKKIEDDIKALYATLYSNDSTICRIANNELRVDASQHLALYDATLPLHEEISQIIAANISFARKSNILEEELMKVVVADEKMYRSLVFHCLICDLEKLFVEYNKARNEAKGEMTPQSNFIQGELLRINKHVFNARDNLAATDNETWDVADYCVKLVDWTSGRRQLPQGKTFKDCFDEGRRLTTEFLKKCEDAFKPLYDAALKELIAVSEKNNGKISTKIDDIKKEDKK